VHLTDELDRRLLWKVMQHLGSDDEIECSRRKGERQRIAGDAGDREFPRRPNEFHAPVESEHIERNAMLSGELPESIRDIAGASTDIEKCREVASIADQGRQFRSHGMDTAEKPVGERDVAMRSTLQRRIAVFVEIFYSPPSRRREDRHP
jgi:hypothetical protein